MGTTDAAVLWETDTGSGKESSAFNQTNHLINHLAELATLRVGDRSREVLNLREAFPHKSHNRDFGNACHPGVANHLRIESGHPLELFRVARTGGLPFEQTPCPVQMANRIDISHEFVVVRERTEEFLLQVSFGLANPNPVISRKLLE